MTITSFTSAHMLAVLPEIILTVWGAAVLITDLLIPKEQKRNLGIMTTIGFGVAILAALIFSRPPAEGQLIFGGMINDDMLAYVFRMLILVAGALTTMLSLDVKDIGDRVEYYVLLIGACIGMSFMASAADLIMLYLAIETTSIVGYVMAGYKKKRNDSTEAGLKYFVYGALTSTVMLYGFSLLYGYTGQTNLYAIVEALKTIQPLILIVASVLLIVGIGFKIAAVPFHFWTPDVYQGAPTPVTAFISTASKSAGFAVLFRVFIAALGVESSPDWMPMLIAMTVVTMTLGNLVALVQTNIKRLLAYSSIAHAGYALIGFIALTELGIASSVFYLMTYVLTNLAAFGVVIIFARTAGSDEIAAYAGLSRRSPYLALAMLVGFLSLSGMPPFAGFYAKFYVFAAVIENPELIWVAVVGVLNAIVGLYYYLIVLKVVWVTPAPEGAVAIDVPRSYTLSLAVLCAGILLLGILPAPWFNWALQAAGSLF